MPWELAKETEPGQGLHLRSAWMSRLNLTTRWSLSKRKIHRRLLSACLQPYLDLWRTSRSSPYQIGTWKLLPRRSRTEEAKKTSPGKEGKVVK